MQSLGYALLLLGLAASVLAFLARKKNRRVLATPLRRTGDIAANPRAGDVSCEGPVRLNAPAYAPCSGQPCLYYEIEVVQTWTKLLTTQNGVKEERGSSLVDRQTSGVVFFVDDGSGPIAVDPSNGIDVELDTSFEERQLIGHGTAMFNGFLAHVPDPGEDKVGESVKVVERIVPIDTQLFVLGRLDEGLAITKPLASRRGRSDLIRRAKRHATMATIASAVFLCPGLALAAFGEPTPDTTTSDGACRIVDESASPCTGTILGDYGRDVTLVVTRAGTFDIRGAAPPNKMLPLVAALDVKDAQGHAVVTNAERTARAELTPGTYTINIRDRVVGAAKSFKGGFSYELSVKRVVSPAASPASAATPTSAASPAVAVTPEPAPSFAAPAKSAKKTKKKRKH